MKEPQKPGQGGAGGSVHYSLFFGFGRKRLAETLGHANPFALPGLAIVERVLAAGFAPDPSSAWDKPFPLAPTWSYVDLDGRHFIVSLDANLQIIAVQERVDEPYHLK